MKITNNDPAADKLLCGDEAILFNLIAFIREQEGALLYSDGKSYLTAQSAPGAPMWIYINDRANRTTRNELFSILSRALSKNERLRINAQDGFVRETLCLFAQKNGFEILKHGVINAYSVSNVNAISSVGELISAESGYSEKIAKLIQVAAIDDNGGELSDKEAIDFARKHIPSCNLFLWRDGQAVSMARIVRYGAYGRITSVVTERSARGKGYAKMLVGELSKRLIKEGRIPVLYARAENASSNACYSHLGFVKKGEICEYTVKIQGVQK